MDYQGVIIEESLRSKNVLKEVHIDSTRVEPVTAAHKTPWLTQWTLHAVTVAENESDRVAEALSKALGADYWYADFKNDATHYVIFPNRIFKVDRSKPEQYQQVINHGLRLGIPEYQLDFSPAMKQWERPHA
ncbi:MAG TPA: hypothetical protein VEP50_01115 [bacterium]|nr:hypothetical protein [bacterium]